MHTITCPACRKILEDSGHLICADKVVSLYHWDDKENKFVISSGTTISLVKDWKQIIHPHSWEKGKNPRNANWKVDHELGLFADEGHARVSNRDNSRADSIFLCRFGAIYEIGGQTASEQEEQARVKILELRLEDETKKRKEAERQAKEERDNRTAEKLLARFQGIGVDGVRVHRPFHSNHASGLHISFDAAEHILYNLEDE